MDVDTAARMLAAMGRPVWLKICRALIEAGPDGWAVGDLAQPPTIFQNPDSWTRHRLRAIQLKHRRMGMIVYSRLRALGATHELAAEMASRAAHW